MLTLICTKRWRQMDGVVIGDRVGSSGYGKLEYLIFREWWNGLDGEKLL